jgi:hypothetical protein
VVTNPTPVYSHYVKVTILLTHARFGLPSSLLTSGFPTHTLYIIFLSPFVLHSPLSYSVRLNQCNYTWRGVHVMKLLTAELSPSPVTSSPFSPNVPLSCVQTPSVYVPPLMSQNAVHTHTKLKTKLCFAMKKGKTNPAAGCVTPSYCDTCSCIL